MMSSLSSNGKHTNEAIIFFSRFFVNFYYNDLKPYMALVTLIDNLQNSARWSEVSIFDDIRDASLWRSKI